MVNFVDNCHDWCILGLVKIALGPWEIGVDEPSMFMSQSVRERRNISWYQST